ncbi:MAG TPA: polymer-forming cytoskeletal protein [Gammaproteobacteria bacterium]|nr:polymer-forming cytoskeletal protein [Gammaproteobacteria bacterium]
MFDLTKKGASASNSSQQRTESGGSAKAESTTSKRTGPDGLARDAAVIGPSIHIDGDLRGEEDLLIEGEVSGTVQLKNNSLTIGPQGKIRADVYAHSIYVDGFMEGDLYGSERVNIRKTAQVRGNVTSPRVSVEDGAKFKGSIEMDPQAVQSALGTNRGVPKTASAGPAAAPAVSRQGPASSGKSSDSLAGKPESSGVAAASAAKGV